MHYRVIYVYYVYVVLEFGAGCIMRLNLVHTIVDHHLCFLQKANKGMVETRLVVDMNVVCQYAILLEALDILHGRQGGPVIVIGEQHVNFSMGSQVSQRRCLHYHDKSRIS